GSHCGRLRTGGSTITSSPLSLATGPAGCASCLFAATPWLWFWAAPGWAGMGTSTTTVSPRLAVIPPEAYFMLLLRARPSWLRRHRAGDVERVEALGGLAPAAGVGLGGPVVELAAFHAHEDDGLAAARRRPA